MGSLNNKIKDISTEIWIVILAIPEAFKELTKLIGEGIREYLVKRRKKKKSKEKFDLSDLDNRTRHEC